MKAKRKGLAGITRSSLVQSRMIGRQAD